MTWTSRKFRAVVALLVLALMWGYNWVVMKEALKYIGAFQFGALRTFLGAVCLFVILLVVRRPLRPREIPALILLGVLQTTGFTGLVIWALVEGGAGKTAVLTYTMPFWVMIMAWPLLGEKIQGVQWLAVLCSVMGLLFILDPLHLGTDLFSMMLAVLGGVFWAWSTLYAKMLNERAPDLDLLSLTAWQMLLGSLPLVLIALVVPTQPIVWVPYLIGAVAFNAIFCNALAWLLWLYALKSLEAGVASMISLLAPVIGVLAAWIQLKEQPLPSELWGMLLIIVALFIISARGMYLRKEPESVAVQE